MNRISIALAVMALLTSSAGAEESGHAPVVAAEHGRAAGHAGHAATQSPDAVLKALLVGNERFVAGMATRPHAGYARRTELASGQHPIAAVVGCADSRVPPELLFDQGLGDLFVVRVAGNVAEPGVVGSVEYAAEHLATPLVVVLGHEGCGAVKATLDGAGDDGNIGSLVKDIRPAVMSACQPASASCDALHEGVHLNARAQARNMLDRSPLLRELVASGKLAIVVATYDLGSGKVTLER
jgi:carbonic anhydrase